LPDQKLKVLMIAPTPYFSDRGCHVRIYEEARTLQKMNIDVRIATYHLGRNMGEIPTYRIPPIPWYKKKSAGPSWHKPYLDLILLFKSLQICRTFRPDIIHAHLHEGVFIAQFLKKLQRIPLLFDCQGSLTVEMVDHRFIKNGTLLYRFFLFLERYLNSCADYIITSSGPSAKYLAEDPSGAGYNIKAVIDGVDTEFFKPYPKDEIRKKYGLPTDLPLVAFLGVLNSYQGIDILLDAISLLKDRGGGCRFLVMGFPEEEYRLKVSARGLNDMVILTGKIDYALAPQYLSAADIAVSPKISLSEANGKLFNYMACGLPTVVFDTPVNREILGDAGIYADYGDAGSLAEKIALLLLDIDLRANLSRRVKEKALVEHSWVSRGKIIYAIYHRLLRAK
jgi:glycosyltransferase involved in cell wall biosynthesis